MPFIMLFLLFPRMALFDLSGRGGDERKLRELNEKERRRQSRTDMAGNEGSAMAHVGTTMRRSDQRIIMNTTLRRLLLLKSNCARVRAALQLRTGHEFMIFPVPKPCMFSVGTAFEPRLLVGSMPSGHYSGAPPKSRITIPVEAQ